MLLTLLGASTSLAQLTPSHTSWGAVEQIRMGNTVVAETVALMVIKPGWDDKWAYQIDASDITIEGPTARGSLATDVGPIAFGQSAEPLAEGLRVTYSFTPSADLPGEGAYLQLLLPTDAAAGGHWLAYNGAELKQEPFPETLVEPYQLHSGPVEWLAWVLPSGEGLRIDLRDSPLSAAILQDDRQFDIPMFELQLPVPGTKPLRAGQAVTFALTFQPFTAEDAATEGTAYMDAAEAQRVEFTSSQGLALGPLAPPAEPIAQYSTAEWTLPLTATYDNPFDPRDISVEAIVTRPDRGGKRLTVPAFFYVPYERDGGDEVEVLSKAGEPEWRLRFAPSLCGEYRLVVNATDRSGTVRSKPLRFTVIESRDPGFVRRSENSPYYLRFDSGQPYFAVGENVCWGGPRQTLDYDMWFPALGRARGNFARIWLVHWNMALEWIPEDPKNRGSYHGLGIYSPDNAWRLDHVMALAREHGIYTMLCLGYHGELQEAEDFFGSQCWTRSPYNAANGGPCAKPDEFWTNEEARRLYKQRLRYYVARWGACTNVQSWEFWNEVVAPAAWVAEMARYLKSIDPYQHLVTTTYGYDEVWEIPEIDFTQTHMYGVDEKMQDSAPVIARHCRDHTSKFGKPHLVGEFGIDWKRADTDHDPEGHGVNLHNGLWSSMASRGMGGAMNWWWDGYIHPLNLYREFRALARFADDVPWSDLDFRFAETTTPALVPGGGSGVSPDDAYRRFPLTPPMAWGRATGTDFTLTDDGRLEGEGAFSSFLYSPSKPDERQPLRFHVTCPDGGTLTLHVGEVAVNARLQVLIDGDIVFDRELNAGPPGEGEYKKTNFREEHQIWISDFDADFPVEIPPGKHTLELRNEGSDWMEVTRYVFDGCVDGRYIDTLLVRGLQTDAYAVLWLQNRASNWYNRTHENLIEPISDVAFTLLGLRDGTYEVTWVDTSTGRPTETLEATSQSGRLVLVPPTITTDIACRIGPANPL